MQKDPRETVQLLTAMAGLRLPPERIAELAQTLPVIQNGIAALAAVDYGDVEPAGAFRPRPEAKR